MLNRIGHIVTFLCLAGILFLNTSPRELIHSFTGHTDTIDQPCTHHDGEMAFESEHHHCDFLDQAVVPFIFSVTHFQLNHFPDYNQPDSFRVLSQIRSTFIHTDSRGPPQV